MACPICDQKPANCDCTAEERRQYGEIEDLEYEVERLRAERRWIPVEERLPEEGIEVLVSVDENSDDCGYHVCLYRGGEYVRSESGYIFGVTHWMPLPEPPEVK